MSETAHPPDADADGGTPGENGQVGSGGESADRLSHEMLFEALSNKRRRFALHYLKQQNGDGPVDLADLSAQVTAWERGVDADDLSYAQRKNVHTSLSQFHAPKLDELGFVRFDRDEGVVELTARAENVDVYLETTSGRELAWGPYLLLLSSVLSGVVFGSLVGLPGLAGLSSESLAVFVAMTFLSSSAFFAYETWTEMRVGVEGPPPEVTDS